MPARDFTVELLLDLTAHKLIITTSKGEQRHMPFAGHSPASFRSEGLLALASLGVDVEVDASPHFEDGTVGAYVPADAERFWRVLAQIDAIFKEFKGSLREETGPVHLWPHHFDLAMLWFSGRLVPDVDPADEENADEQMNFGFVPGDDAIPHPYFYITAYPQPDGWKEAELPAPASWTTEGFDGALLMYDDLRQADDPKQVLLEYMRTAHQAGAALMT